MEKKYKNAKGLKGILMGTSDARYFRVRTGPDRAAIADHRIGLDFKDYRLDHYDLEVLIIDQDAYLYDGEDDDQHILNYSPQTLGWDREVIANPTAALINPTPWIREYAEDLLKQKKDLDNQKKTVPLDNQKKTVPLALHHFLLRSKMARSFVWKK